jgi:hypothetical protein
MSSAVYQFGSGVLFGYPIGGNEAANPTPLQFGTIQDVSLDISFEVKELYGRNQFPEDTARAKGKITGKAKFAQLNGKLVNDLFFGQVISAGQTKISLDESHPIPATPFQVTPTPPSSGVFVEDLGVRSATTGLALTKVAGSPTTGQYSVSAGVYTFAAADTLLVVLISYSYSVTTGSVTAVNQQLMGYAPRFEIVLEQEYNTQQSNVKLYSCVATKLTRATKIDDYTIPEFDFSAFANPAGKLIDFYDAV